MSDVGNQPSGRQRSGDRSSEFTAEQYAEGQRRVRTYNRSIARAIQTEDEKALVSAIQESEGWSEGVTENWRTWAQAVWHTGHETERLGATASAAFHGFRPELLAQLHRPQPRPMSPGAE